jgi:hypothetical protein
MLPATCNAQVVAVRRLSRTMLSSSSHSDHANAANAVDQLTLDDNRLDEADTASKSSIAKGATGASAANSANAAEVEHRAPVPIVDLRTLVAHTHNNIPESGNTDTGGEDVHTGEEVHTGRPHEDELLLRQESQQAVEELEAQTAVLSSEIDVFNQKINALLEKFVSSGFSIARFESLDSLVIRAEQLLHSTAGEGEGEDDVGLCIESTSSIGSISASASTSESMSTAPPVPTPFNSINVLDPPQPPSATAAGRGSNTAVALAQLGITRRDLQELKDLESEREKRAAAVLHNKQVIETLKRDIIE